MGEPMYGRETPVNLRSQRLRRATGEAAPDMQTDEAAAADTEEAADPYGVGQEALAAAEQSPAEDAAPAAPRLFADDAAPIEVGPARWGWRGRVNAATGMGLRAQPDEQAARQAERETARAIGASSPGIVTIASPKGGSGKTPTALMLAAAFGTHRRGVVAWDASESPGTLADRAIEQAPSSIADVLGAAGRLASGQASAAELAAFLRPQPAGHEVLGTALDGSQEHMEIGADECAAVMAVLRRHRDLMVIDTGTNSYAPAWRWAVTHADQLIVPVPLRVDAAKAAYWMLWRLRSEGYDELVATARVLFIAAPGDDSSLERRIYDQLTSVGASRFSRVPYDPLLASGGRVGFEQVAAATRRAYTDLAGRVAGDLAIRAGGSVLTGRDPDGFHEGVEAREFPRVVTEGGA